MGVKQSNLDSLNMDESMDTEEVGEVNSNERNTLGTQWGRRERQDRTQ